MKNKKIMVVAAHADDEILGCGATIARLVALGNEVVTLILGEGKTSRENEDIKAEQVILTTEAKRANNAIGVKEVCFENLPDNRFDSIDLLDIVKVIELYKNKIKPDVVFTHCAGDLNIDHKITHTATLTATRPMAKESVKEIYGFEVLSSTEWAFPPKFAPNVFVDVTDYMDVKLSAMVCYESELREYPHPRSLETIRLSARLWASKMGCGAYAEAFELIRKMCD